MLRSEERINMIKLSGKRKTAERLIAFLLIIFVLSSVAFGCAVGCELIGRNYRADLSFEGKYKNVILTIGDGMGFNHIDCAEGFYGKKTFMRAASLGCVNTVTDSNALFSPTDSAASATALSTGKKTNNGAIARLNGKDIVTNAERAKQLGMAVGVIATEGVNGATPAAFSSHANSRGDSAEIFEGQLKSGIDLFLGGNKSYYDGKAETIEENGYVYFNDPERDFSGCERVWGAYDIKALPDSAGEGVTLSELVERAMKFLENASDRGYFLMFEESYIDKRSHKNNISEMVERLKSYDSAIKIAVERGRSNGDTLVISTADHETGELTPPKNADYKNLSDGWFKRSGHTRRNVPCFFFMPIGKFEGVIDNTQIADACRYYIENR